MTRTKYLVNILTRIQIQVNGLSWLCISPLIYIVIALRNKIFGQLTDFFSQKEKGLQLYDLYLTAESEYILCSRQFKYLTKPDQAIGFGDKGKRKKKNAIMLDIGRWIKHMSFHLLKNYSILNSRDGYGEISIMKIL